MRLPSATRHIEDPIAGYRGARICPQGHGQNRQKNKLALPLDEGVHWFKGWFSMSLSYSDREAIETCRLSGVLEVEGRRAVPKNQMLSVVKEVWVNLENWG